MAERKLIKHVKTIVKIEKGKKPIGTSKAPRR